MAIIPANEAPSQAEIARNALLTVRAHLDVLNRELDEAREKLLTCSMRWQAAQGVPEGGRFNRGAVSHQDSGYLQLRRELLKAEREYHRYLHHKIPHQLALIRHLAESQVAPMREAWAQEHYPRLVEAIAVAALGMEAHPQGSKAWLRARARWNTSQIKLLDLWETEHGQESDPDGGLF